MSLPVTPPYLSQGIRASRSATQAWISAIDIIDIMDSVIRLQHCISDLMRTEQVSDGERYQPLDTIEQRMVHERHGSKSTPSCLGLYRYHRSIFVPVSVYKSQGTLAHPKLATYKPGTTTYARICTLFWKLQVRCETTPYKPLKSEKVNNGDISDKNWTPRLGIVIIEQMGDRCQPSDK